MLLVVILLVVPIVAMKIIIVALISLARTAFGINLCRTMFSLFNNMPASSLNESTARDDHTPREVVIIGSGPAGCTAAIYTARAMLKPLVIAGYSAGGQLMLTNDVENFPGYRTPISGPDLMDDLIQQSKNFGAEFWMTNCNFIDTSVYPFRVHLPNGTVTAKAIIVATGAEALWMNAPQEEEFRGKGISTCATCDGMYLLFD